MRNNKFKSIFKTGIVALGCLTIISGCSSKTSTETNEKVKTSGEEKIHIVTTFYPMYEFTKNIAGDKAEVELLIPSSIEPHEWEPSPKDMEKINNAEVFVYNSQYMETWVPKVEEAINDSKKPLFVKASDGISLMEGIAEEEEGEEESHEHEDGHVMDPHVWLSPVLAQKEVDNITQALIKKDPENKEVYEKNSKDYIHQLQELDQQYHEGLDKFAGKEIITQHAAFGYLAKEYGLKQIPIAGLSPEEEPSPSRLAELKAFALDHNLHTIYFEELASPKVAQALASELDAKTKVLNTLEGLSKEDQAKGLNYIEEMTNNLKSLVETLSE
ncbi:metal ABC transporter substrate-binding protein [Neobacillus jeddahensis]|uniref:metal ABC transporter substrate-binding protein n=1 Tax=Neobacillus jeddahensis TaxID=1461580 RepID=UPI000BDEE9AD